MLDGGIVLLKRGVEPALGKWVFPGGYVDRGESVQDAAVRETKEESQLEVKLGPLLNVYSYPRSPNVIVVYTVMDKEGKLHNLAVKQIPDSRFTPPILAALSHWTFQLAQLNGQPVALKVLIGIPLLPYQ